MNIIQCISAFFSCFGYSIKSGLQHSIKLPLCNGILACSGWFVFQLIGKYVVVSETIQTFLAMLCVYFAALLLAKHFKAPLTIFIVPASLPFVPGNGIYQTMLYAVQNNQIMFIQSTINTIGVAFAIAMAIVVGNQIAHIYKIIDK